MKILAVDDQLEARMFLEQALRILGYEAEIVGTATEALELARSGEYPLMLLDWMMPGTDGLVLCRRIRALPDGELPVIVIFTGRDGTDELKKVLKAGADDYLTKPLEVDYLKIRLTIAEDRAQQRIARREAEERLRISEERYALAAMGANDGLWDWDLEAKEIYYSDRFKTMLGVEPGEVGNSPEEWLGRIHPADLQRFETTWQDHLDARLPHFECSHRVRHRDSTYLWVVSRGLAVRRNGAAYRMAGSLTDITGRGVHDQLTGLPNRKFFTYRLENAIERHKRRQEYSFGVLLFGLDRFKRINDSLGHVIGDELLIAVGQRFESSLRATDTLARLDATLARVGGDEYIVLIEDIRDINHAIRATDRFRRVFEDPFELNGQEVFANASVGIVLYSSSYEDPADMMRDANIALHRAKTLGGAHFAVFDETMHKSAVTRLKIESDLRRARESDELRVFYQPILALESGTLAGLEALLRWQHPRQGLIAPPAFLSVAEESELIISIDRWILAESCRQIARWEEELMASLDMTLNVNLSARQFSQSDLVEQVEKLLVETNLPGNRLKLEITESVIMRAPESAAEVLVQLKDLGVRLSVDDFGTGYSSMSYLHHFPFDTLKIDQSFVAGMSREKGGLAIVRAIVELAHGLDMDVVAEGIETAEQGEHLREIGCDYGQGFYYSVPVAETEARTQFAHLPARDETT